mgnify:CR=1 FL=1
MHWFLSLLLAIAILVVQHFLSTREKAFWGALLPVVYAGFMVYLNYSGQSADMDEFWFISILGTVILLSEWASGREAIKKRRKNELEKMKTLDMN